jgi:apolipoprotein N-acyltransferase
LNRIHAVIDPPSKTRPAPDSAGIPFVIHGHRTLALLGLASLILKSLIFTPIGIWPLAFICLVPWVLMVTLSSRAPRVYLYSFLWAFGFFLVNLRWLYDATGPGYVALSFYLSIYFPVMACPLRHVARRRNIPLAIALPCIYVAGEFLRAIVMSGFPWFFLSHSVFKVLTLIQVSDLVGAYGPSFLIAAVNGAIADLILDRLQSRHALLSEWITRRPQARRGAVVAAALLIFVCIYGQVQLRRSTTSIGPKIALLQGDYVMSVDGEESNDVEKRATYFSMANAAAAHFPDLYLLPETPWMMYLNPEARDFTYPPLSRSSFDAFQKLATSQRAHVVTGSASLVLTPKDLLAKDRKYNSATIFHPDGREPERYDKVHLVYFGEVVPFRFTGLRFLYFWMNSVMPFSGPKGDYEYSLFHGDGFRIFQMKPASIPERTFRFGVPICYEDVIPYVSRHFTNGGASKQVDFLLNISNDGWFGRNHQQSQHLSTCAFRAVENRVGIARAVNTGVSAFIDPSGKIRDVVRGDPNDDWPREVGYAVANVLVDSRYTFYTRFGDWFGWLCVVIWVLFFVDYWIMRARALIEE